MLVETNKQGYPGWQCGISEIVHNRCSRVIPVEILDQFLRAIAEEFIKEHI